MRQQFRTRVRNAAGLIAGLAALQVPAAAQVTDRVSVDSFYRAGDSWANAPALSADGRHAVFSSLSSNLVVGDTNGKADVFVRDRELDTTVRIGAGNGDSGEDGRYDISASGRWVVYHSLASDLAAVDTNGTGDVFLHDRDPDENGIFDEGNGTTELISETLGGSTGDGESGGFGVAISGDGSKIAFSSRATDLAIDMNPGLADILVWDRVSGTLTNVSLGFDELGDPAGADDECYTPDLSDDGSRVVFESKASNLLNPLSADEDTNGKFDVFYGDTSSDSALTRARASLGYLGQLGSGGDSGAISGDGSQVVFESYGTTVTVPHSTGALNVYVRDIVASETTRVSALSDGSAGNGASWEARISGDGQYVTFLTEATNLFPDVSSYWDLVHVDRDPEGLGFFDPTKAVISLAGVTYEGKPIHFHAFQGALSADGRCVSFETTAGTVVPYDEGDLADGFVRDLDGPCVQPVAYGTPAANSTGVGGYMGLGGSTSVAANDLVLEAYDLPAMQFGIAIYGPEDGHAVVDNGFLLVGAGGLSIFRLDAVSSGTEGTFAYPLDLTSPPHATGAITSGSTWYFQFWFRDTVGEKSNFTNALRITFCD